MPSPLITPILWVNLAPAMKKPPLRAAGQRTPLRGVRLGNDYLGRLVEHGSDSIASEAMAEQTQLTRATYERLTDSFRFEARGEIELKGKGLVETFLVTAPRKLAPHGRAAPR